MVLVAVLMLGLHDALGVEMMWSVAVIAALGLVGFFILGIWRFNMPTRAEAIARLDETLPGHPIQALTDTQAIGGADPASQIVWEAHRSRMRQRAQQMARAVPPAPNLAPRDPFGLRFMALLALCIALMFGSVLRIGNAPQFGTGGGVAQAAAGPAWEGWLDPPGYTGLPVLYLNDLEDGLIEAPQGSAITLRLYGEPGALTIAETVSGRVDDVPSAAEQAQDFTISMDGELRIDGPGGRVWQVSVMADRPPEIFATGPAEASALGAFTMPFEAQDDYEVVAARAEITLDLGAVERTFGLALEPETQTPIRVQLPLPVARSRRVFSEVLVEDFSKHPWANLPVRIRFSAEDAAGNIGQGGAEEVLLAARHFFDPMAAAVVELRRDLLWNRANALRVATLLRAISHRPEGVFKSETSYLRLRFILRRLEAMTAYGLTDEGLGEIAEAMWNLALQLEEGTLSDALERMRQAQERLSEAMKNGASDAEIARLMDELRDATRDYLNQMERQTARENGADEPDRGKDEGETMQMTQDDLQRMMDRIQELMEQGRMAEAQQALQQFQEMMENMRVTEGGQGNGQNPGQQAMEGLAESLREQQGLSDQAFRDLQEQFNPGANAGQSRENEGRSGGEGRGQSHEGQGQGSSQGEGQGQNGQPGQDGEQGQGEQSLAQRQNELRRELDTQRRSLPGAGTEGGDAARDALDRAGRAMDGAEQALRQDDLAEAIDRQAEAMEALRDGMRALGEAMAESNQRNQGQQGDNAQMAGRQKSDPLGRNLGGSPGVEQDMLQGEDVYRRARDLLDDIRRRAGENARPERERSYLRRLLDRF